MPLMHRRLEGQQLRLLEFANTRNRLQRPAQLEDVVIPLPIRWGNRPPDRVVDLFLCFHSPSLPYCISVLCVFSFSVALCLCSLSSLCCAASSRSKQIGTGGVCLPLAQPRRVWVKL